MPKGVYQRPILTKKQKQQKFMRKSLVLSCGCWFYIGKSPRGRTKQAWKLFKGNLEDGKFLLHSCDMPKCENPKHLHFGSQSENIKEMYDRGRANLVTPILKGEDNPAHKLVASQVLKIRRLDSEGYKHSYIASLFSVSRTTIGYIVERKLWRHI